MYGLDSAGHPKAISDETVITVKAIDFDTVLEKIHDMDRKYDDMTSRLATSEDKQAELTRRLNQSETALADVTLRLNQSETSQSDVTSRLSQYASNQTVLESRVMDAERNLSSVLDRMSGYQQAVIQGYTSHNGTSYALSKPVIQVVHVTL